MEPKGTDAAGTSNPVSTLTESLEREREALLEADRSHEDLDSREQYAAFLGRCLGFVQPLEDALARRDSWRWTMAGRHRKCGLLVCDLQALGVSATQIAALPRCHEPSGFERLEVAIGWRAVLERSTLAHGTLFRRLAARLPGEAAFASSYLKSHALPSGSSWRLFLDSVTPLERQLDLDSTLKAVAVAIGVLGDWRRAEQRIVLDVLRAVPAND